MSTLSESPPNCCNDYGTNAKKIYIGTSIWKGEIGFNFTTQFAYAKKGPHHFLHIILCNEPGMVPLQSTGLLEFSDDSSCFF